MKRTAAPALCQQDGSPVADGATLCQTCTADLETALYKIIGRARPAATPQRHPGNTTAPDTYAAGQHGSTPTTPLDHDTQPGLAAELDLAVTRQAVFGRRNGPRGTEKPMPVDLRAGYVLHKLKRALRSAAFDLGWPALGAPLDELVNVLLSDLERLRHLEHAAEHAGNIEHAVTLAETAIDRAPDRHYLGPCGAPLTNMLGTSAGHCTVDLYADAASRSDLVECTACGTAWDRFDRQRELLEEAHDQALPAADIARALTALGDPVTPDRIRVWADRGRLIAHGHLPATAPGRRERPLYRVGDIVQLLTEDRARRARKATPA